jgi:hypothetical protein
VLSNVLASFPMLKRIPGCLRVGATVLASTASLAASPATQSPAGGGSPVDLAGVVRAELAGNPLDAYPHFEYVRTFMEGAPISVAVDPTRYPGITGWSGEIYLVAHKELDEWIDSPGLLDVRGAPQAATFAGADVESDTVLLDSTRAATGEAGTGLGVAYDVVLDTNMDRRLDAGDWIDGLAGEPGLFVAHPTQVPGPLAVTEALYSGGTFLGQDLYYPTDIATLGQLPLVVVSHGNGHNYTWYDHIGYHLASYGCIVMSHQNNTQPGIETASTTTLTNTEYLLANQATIAGGALLGHLDVHRIVWIGHSRGGEGVVRAYDRIFDGTYTPVNFTRSDIVLVSSIAPTDFLGPASSNPHDVNYHLWVGGADADVTGCADCSLCQSFHLLDRSVGNHQSISLHGVGHGAFHDGGGSTVATGPCQVSRADTHELMKSYLLPLVKKYTEGNLPAEDFLWRQWEHFHSPGLPEGPCIVVDLEYTPGPSPDRFVVDDFQSQPAASVSSSGGRVESDFDTLVEGRFDDPNSDFTTNTVAMNGMTMGDGGDSTAGITFSWSGGDRGMRFSLPTGSMDLGAYRYVAFRVCQITRDPLNEAWFGDQQFEVGLRDVQGQASFIGIGAYGGGVEVPYQRSGCGAGVGWGNEFETIRIRIEDFTRNGSGIDLANIASVELRCGPMYGSKEGRLGLDDLVLTRR